MSLIEIINFGLHPDMGWRLMSFLNSDLLSKLPLTGSQIDVFSDILNWDILSNKFLPGWIIVKYADKIDWPSFLINKQKKNILSLFKVKHKLEENKDLFLKNIYVKNMYYSSIFLVTFPDLVDWNWCAKNKQIEEYILLRYWNKMKINIISKYQKLSENVLDIKKNELNWEFICKNKLSEQLINKFHNYVKWPLICKHQELSESFILENKSCCNKNIISQYQKLSDIFIINNHKWLNMDLISLYQDLSIEFIKEYHNLLNLDNLIINKNFNTKNNIQIIKNDNVFYIIDSPILQNNNKILFCKIEPFNII